jgi:signal transduction histidine kinase
VSYEHLGLFDTPPGRRQVRLGAAIVVLLYLTSLPIVVVGGVRLPEVGPFIPTVDAIMFVGELITATLLFSQASVSRSRALAILGGGYLYTALLLIPHALTFPGAFSRTGLLGAGVNTTAWVAILRYPAFAIAVILYAQLKRADSTGAPATERPAPNIGAHVVAAIVLATGAVMLAISGWLPPFMFDAARVIQSQVIAYQATLSAFWVAAIVMLMRRRISILDLWLAVALAGWLLQSLLNMVEEGRFTVAWYWFYAITLFSHLVVMLALVTESSLLYARLALSISVSNRERETRLTSIDALAAAISHEIGQPLSAVATHQSASLKWLTAERPDVGRAIKSLRGAIEAECLAIGVIKSVRATFARRTGARTAVDLVDLARSTAALLESELAGAGVSLTFAPGEAPPTVLADRVQLQLVLINLLTNAIEAHRATGDRPRNVAISLATQEGRGVMLEVSDNGVGIAREDMARIFDPFFTTKSNGAGLGLSLCRIIVEAHGGRLWASRGDDHGATFYVELPANA